MSRNLLAPVVQEIVHKLNNGDWGDFETAGGESYYVIGLDAWISELPGHAEAPKPRLRWAPSQLGEYTVRSGVASARPAEEYLERARRRIAEFGISRDQVDSLLAGDVSGLGKWELGDPQGERFEAFVSLLEAAALIRTTQGQRVPDSDERLIIERDRERIYLQELATKYPKIVDRSSRLEALSFRDAQLEEASRCYLYGFWRATIILSATALDTALASRVDADMLKRAEEESRRQGGGYFTALVRAAANRGLLGEQPNIGEEPRFADAARFVFQQRNAVAHRQETAGSDAAERVFDAARRVIEHLVDRESPRAENQP